MDRLRQIALAQWKLRVSEPQFAQFQRYSEELILWNQHTNLTAITDPEAIELRHFADSLSCLLVMPPLTAAARIIDVGTGAGFPGLPIKILFPDMKVTLLEATGKKVTFLRHIIDVLGLRGVEIVNDRVETVGHHPDHREAYDWVLARAVAGLATLAEYLLPLARVGGIALAQKGESASQEAQEAQHAIQVVGGRIKQLTPVELPGVAETHYLVEISKIAPTPSGYPRRVGVPSKKPL